MNGLFEKVLHHIEGNETEIQSWVTKDGVKQLSINYFGPDRWIERAATGRLTALDFLAVILFSIRDTFNLDAERKIVEKWALEIRKAASNGEITARDTDTLLPLASLPDGWDWLVFSDDADKLIAARGMTWKPSEAITYLLEQCRADGWEYRDLKTGQIVSKYWLAGCEPHPSPAIDVAIEPSRDAPSKMPAPVRHKLRKNSLDTPIEKAIMQSETLDTGAVYLKLKELALSGEAPFTGQINGDALCYTTDNNEPGDFTKNALEHRLRARRKS